MSEPKIEGYPQDKPLGDLARKALKTHSRRHPVINSQSNQRRIDGAAAGGSILFRDNSSFQGANHVDL
jgi:hypothetical protein